MLNNKVLEYLNKSLSYAYAAHHKESVHLVHNLKPNTDKRIQTFNDDSFKFFDIILRLIDLIKLLASKSVVWTKWPLS